MKQSVLIDNIPNFYSNNDTRGRGWRHTYDDWKNGEISPLVAKACVEQKIQPVEVYPIEVYVKFLYGKGAQRYDWENHSPVIKAIQDCLKDRGVIIDDSCTKISRGTVEAVRQPKSYNSVLYFMKTDTR